MSKNTFALLEGTQSDDVKDILKNANSEKKQDTSAVVEDKKGGQKQGNNNRKQNDRPARPASSQQRGNNRRQFTNNNTVASPSEESGEYSEGNRPQRGGKRDSGYAPPRRGFAYDRSISRTGRGRGMKKGGAGGHNWGKPEQDNLEAPQEQAENPATPTTPAAEGEQPKEAEQQQPAVQQPVEEEEKDDSVTFAEYQKKQKEALSKLALDAFKKNSRGAGESIAVDPKALAFKNEIKREAAEIKIKSAEQAKPATPVAAATDKPAAAKKEASKKGEKLDLGALLKDVPTRQEQSERRGGRGGRGGRGNFGGRGRGNFRGRGGRGNAGSRVAPPPSLNDTSSFPALK